MFGFLKRKSRDDVIERLHTAIVDASRRPSLYDSGGFPDNLDGRFESLTLHVLLILRRLRDLPPPAKDVAQELIDMVFAHLEVAMRESGVGDVGVPKRMKKLGSAFYDRTSRYEIGLEGRDRDRLAEELGRRLSSEPARMRSLATYMIEAEATLASADLDRLLGGPPFPEPTLADESDRIAP